MSLRHALLAILTAEPMTGYDLMRYFDGSVAYVWSAPHSQIYPELRRMHEQGLIDGELVSRGERAEKRRYSINEKGIAALKEWADELLPLQPGRDAHRLKAAYFEWSSFDGARRQLSEHLNHYRTRLAQWERLVEDIEAGRVPLLQRRLKRAPRNAHDAIVAYKLFAFRGEIARARAEMAWAEEGLALVDRLEREAKALARDETVFPYPDSRDRLRPVAERD
jgi:DNA-binding PadR family transcriptional regulator